MTGLLTDLPASIREHSFIFDVQTEKSAHWKRDKNIRDVLVYVHEWHLLLLRWVRANQQGENVAFLPPEYNWRTYGKMNEQLWEKHQQTPYETAIQLLTTSHADVMELAATYTNDALFSKGVFAWTGTSTLGSYFVSATASHYEWVYKKIKKHIKLVAKEQEKA